jgi:ATP-dependent RNA helicase SUPV3L1/SUV3
MRTPVTALLGPTNTGKTYIAIERLLAHRSGMIGFPLRLLARENYDRIAALRGKDAVALITGEERVVPPAPSYYVCTVEAMPLDRRVAFLAVDEIQLAADRERGHVFTDRLLHARGLEETMFVGAETMRPLVRRLLPDAALLTRPRLSTLSYAPPKKLRKLPRRSAVVVFSLAELYLIAERLRREAGGSALVFGALSPRTRNAQVALYQAGEVDYLVATDAIGMGLNLDIDHVVFTSLTKFDGTSPRRLRPAEVAQIAGRAGRHVKDGRFGPTDELGPFDEELVRAVESHRFDPLHSIYWRSADLSFASPAALLGSLERQPPDPVLVRMRRADDHRAFAALAADAEISGLARHPETVRVLWDVSQVPDFRAVLTDAHTRLLAEIFRFLLGPSRRLDEDWVAAHVRDLDRTDGDVETLLGRIASIRTWTYVSHRPAWLADPRHWQQRTRAVEDRLSDALHERLTEQFVDRRTAVIVRHDPGELLTVVGETGEVTIQGLRAGVLEGFRFVADRSVAEDARPLLAAANRALRAGIRERVGTFAREGDDAFSLRAGGPILWRGFAVARLSSGESLLEPQVEPLPSELLDPPLREQVRRRLAAWLEGRVRGAFGPLLAARDAPLSGSARGVAFVLAEGLGSVPRRSVAELLGSLLPPDRQALSRLGVTLGRLTVFLPALLKPDVVRLRAALFLARHGPLAVPSPDGGLWLALEAAAPSAYYAACGYQPAGRRALRVDALHRIAVAAARLSRSRPFAAPRDLVQLVGGEDELAAVLSSLGYERRGALFSPRRSGARADGLAGR